MPAKKISSHLIPANQTKTAGLQNRAVPKRKTTKIIPTPSKDKKITKSEKTSPPANEPITCEKIEPKIIAQNKKDDAKGSHERN